MKTTKKATSNLPPASPTDFYKHVLDTYFSKSPDLMYLLDQHCSLIDCNSHFSKLVGLDSKDEKAIGYVYNCMKSSKYWSEQQIQVMKTKDINTIVSGQAMLDQPELPVIDQNKDIHHYVASRIPILDKDQEVTALLVILKEVTAHKIMEDQFEKMKLALENFNKMDKQPIQSAEPIQFTDIPHRSLHVLVIEDEPIAQKAAQTVLMQIDCVVDLATDDQKAIELFVPGKYDLVFMDIGLEKTTGYVLAEQLRELEKGTNYHVPIFVLTGRQSELLSADCYFKQMEGAISKPLTLEQVRQLIQHYIHNIDVKVTGLTVAQRPDYITTERTHGNIEIEERKR